MYRGVNGFIFYILISTNSYTWNFAIFPLILLQVLYFIMDRKKRQQKTKLLFSSNIQRLLF